MSTRFRETYQFEGGLESAVIDLVRVGSAGFGSGVRQLATRLLRSVPPEIENPEEFRSAMQTALAESAKPVGLRFAQSELPTEEGTTHQLVNVEIPLDVGGLVLDETVELELSEIVRERLRAEELARHGLEPTRTLLLSGPPGVGKTMATQWLAAQLGVPLVSMDLSSVISSFLGSSGRNIRAAFDYAKSGPCLLLLDEFDAIAKKREDDSDVGELKRVVTVVLAELDRWPSSSLLVAATNHPQLLDSAVGRRFDRRVTITLPTLRERKLILRHLSTGLLPDGSKVLELAAQHLEGSSGSEIATLWRNLHRRSILDAKPLHDVLLLGLLAERRPGPARDALWLSATKELGLSNRCLANLVNVTHPTVAAALKRAKAKA